MVSVLATAHMHPASTAQMTRCGACPISARTCAVPRMNAGTLQRARKTPSTMMSETVIGEIVGLTSLMGASAPPSHAPAANPQKMPTACRLRSRVVLTRLSTAGTSDLRLVEDMFNGAYPEGRVRRLERSAGSRNADRWRRRETGCGEWSRQAAWNG